MSEPATYAVTTLHDLLRVPIDRLTDCLRDIETGLMLHHLTFGERAAEVKFKTVTWIDDGARDVTLRAGDEEYTLKVTADAP
jgi:hypothetical protein